MSRSGVTAATVAARAGVSKWTVIRALKPDTPIAEDTRRRVLEVAKELNYQPNLLARSLATNQTHQVAILIDDFSNPYMLPSLGYLASRLQDEGLLAVVLNINENYSHLRAITNALQRRMDAIVSFGVSFSPRSVIENLSISDGTPVFVLARESTFEQFPSLYTDAGPAAKEMGSYLHEKGYRRPAFFGGPKSGSTALGRRRHYLEFWRGKGVGTMAEVYAGLYRLETALDVIRAYFHADYRKDRPDVLLCENDILAIAAMDVAKFELGLDVPGDLAIVGFDDISLSGTKAYHLTTVRQPYQAMIDALIEMILMRQQPRTIALNGDLIIRSSA